MSTFRDHRQPATAADRKVKDGIMSTGSMCKLCSVMEATMTELIQSTDLRRRVREVLDWVRMKREPVIVQLRYAAGRDHPL